MPIPNEGSGPFHSQDIAEICKPALCQVISAISENHTAAAWQDGIEFVLWKVIKPDFIPETRFGALRDFQISPIERKALVELSSLSGGWFHWAGDTEDPQFINAEDWEAMYEKANTK